MQREEGFIFVSIAIAWYDLTGMELHGELVKEARSKEMENVNNKNVWFNIPRATTGEWLESDRVSLGTIRRNTPFGGAEIFDA
eukprot:10183405-Heterocapsa_arctica.AAC.1